MQMPNTFPAAGGARVELAQDARTGQATLCTEPTRVGELGRRGLGARVPSKAADMQYWLDRAEEAQLQAEEMTYAELAA